VSREASWEAKVDDCDECGKENVPVVYYSGEHHICAECLKKAADTLAKATETVGKSSGAFDFSEPIPGRLILH